LAVQSTLPAFANGTPDWFISDVSEVIYKLSADTPAHLSSPFSCPHALTYVYSPAPPLLSSTHRVSHFRPAPRHGTPSKTPSKTACKIASAKQNRHAVVALSSPRGPRSEPPLTAVSTITVPDAGAGRRPGCSEHSDPTPPTIQLDQSHTPATHTFTCPPTVTCPSTVPCKSVGAVFRLRHSTPPPCCRTRAAP